MNFEIIEILEIICCTSLDKFQNVYVLNGEAIANLAQLMVEHVLTLYIDNQWPEVDNLRLFVER